MILIFSGYNQRAVIAFIRTLEKHSLRYVIAASGADDSILDTAYRNKVAVIRESKNLTVEIISRIVADLKRKCNEDIWIAPSTEYLNRILIENRDYFEKMGCVIPLSNKEIYETVSDKQKFAKECSKYGIKSPDTVEDASLFVMPMVAKPNKYISSDGKIYSPIFILGKESHSRFMETHQKSDFTFQQFLDGGESLYLLFYFAGNGRSWTYSQKNIAQQKGGKSIVAAVGAQYHLSDELVSPYVRMFKEMGFYGLVMVEVRIYDGENYMIEANPRFWGPSQLFCDAGNNFFECMLADYGFLKDEPDFKNDAAYYFWSGGIDMRELNLNKTHKNRMDTGFIRGGIQHTPHSFLWHDGGIEYFEKNYDRFLEADIYRRNDTIHIYESEKFMNEQENL